MRTPFITIGAVLLLLGACLVSLAAETPDPHYASPRTSSVVRQSTFLHGYLHGYEDGYSLADIDLQLAREPRNPAKIKEAHASTGYRDEFGPHRVFDAGFLEGFRVGYADSLAGRVFRAVDVIRRVMDLPVDPVAAAEPPRKPLAPQPRVPHVSALFDQVAPHSLAGLLPKLLDRNTLPGASPFDEGFSGGYSSGRRRGLADARSALPFATQTATCPAALSRRNSGSEPCTAYVRGFAMGYSDGYVNVAMPEASAASSAQSK